jgi:hypothetical protein
MNKASDFFIKMNPLIKPILNTSFHYLLSSRLVLMRFTGRKSGKTFVTPVGYTAFDDTVVITLTETHNRNWWRNFREPWPMEIKLKGQWLQGEAVWIAPGCDEYIDWFEQIFNRDKFMPKIFKIHNYDRSQGLRPDQVDTLLSNSSGLVKFKNKA